MMTRSYRQLLAEALVSLRSYKSIWEKGKTSELRWWDDWARTRGLDWPQDFVDRLNPNLPLQKEVSDLLDAGQQEIDILDVGAGPLTCLGKTWGDRSINITAIDPLAEHYEEILGKNGLVPVVKTKKGEAERLSEYFAPDSFHFAHARNCLDHSYDPMAAIREMITVVKRGCSVLLEHKINEGRRVKYVGLHQWNFSVEQGEFLISSRRRTRNVTRQLASLCTVDCQQRGEWVRTILQKT